MRAVIQRVSHASVTISGAIKATIGHGLVVLLGIAVEDTIEDVAWLTGKIVQMRIFGDENDLMNIDVKQAGGDIMLISQFTLHAAYKKGNRPSFIRAARPEQAIPLYEQVIAALAGTMGRPIATGIFGADMKVGLVNDGPVTIVIDSRNRE